MKKAIKNILFHLVPPLGRFYRFQKSQTSRVSFMKWCKFWLSRNKSIYWPVHENSEITHPNNIFVGINSKIGIRPGDYIQGNGGLYIGDYVTVSPNCGIITGNHNPLNHLEHIVKEVIIEDYCWIGMNSMLLPGVHLGPRTVVAAGSVVTKSFPDGFCVIGGNPAKILKELEKDKFVPPHLEEEYYGYVPKAKFSRFATRHLKGNKYFNLMMEKTINQ